MTENTEEQDNHEVDADDIDVAETNSPANQDAEDDSDDDGVSAVLFGDADDADDKADDAEPVEGQEPAVESRAIREVRAAQRRSEAERKRLQRELDELRASKSPKDQDDNAIPPKPALWDDGIGGDAELFELKLQEHLEAKAKHAEKQRAKETAQQTERQAAQEKLQAYRKAYDAIASKVPTAKDAEAMAADLLSADQQAVIFEAADTPAMAAQLVYQIGMGLLNGNKDAEAIVATTNLGKFAKSIGQLELKMMSAPKKKAVPAPEKPVKNAGVAKAMPKGEKELIASGDYSALAQFYADQRKSKSN